MAACRFFDALRVATGGKTNVPHIHWDPGTGRWTGDEETGLVEGRQLRPDGFLADETGETRGTVYLFHGNRWHGFPEGHPRFDEVFYAISKRTGKRREWKASDRYARTMEDHQAYVAAGFKLFFVWENEFSRTQLKRNPVPLLSILHSMGPSSYM
jgi:hypothetical protein